MDRLRHLVPVISLSAESNGGQAAMIGWESSEPVAPLATIRHKEQSPKILTNVKVELLPKIWPLQLLTHLGTAARRNEADHTVLAGTLGAVHSAALRQRTDL